MASASTGVQPSSVELGDGLAARRGGYLKAVDFCRVVVCTSVVVQHSFAWTGVSTNVTGPAFVTILHFTRNAFFFLSGLVVCYAEVTRPRSLWRFWERRYVQIGVPFLVWTGISVVFTILTGQGSWSDVGHMYGNDLLYGYYQLYVIVVLIQFYFVFPLLLRLLQATSDRFHVLIMSISVAVALLIGIELHYNPDLGVLGHVIHQIGDGWPWSVNLLSYQVYFVAGVIVAYHLDRVLPFVVRWWRRIVAASVAAGVVTLLWYLIVIWLGASTGSASDIYGPIAVAWSLAAIAGVFTLGCRWAQKRSGRPAIIYLAELTGGIYFCHVVIINLVRSALYSNLVGGEHLPWPIKVVILFVGTIVLASAFVALMLRTPLRWVLTGPVRPEQRARVNASAALSGPVDA
jgi:peptidoglycan/LPS O-acetylase OafA/YrhL